MYVAGLPLPYIEGLCANCKTSSTFTHIKQDSHSMRLNQPQNTLKDLTSIERARFYLSTLLLARCLCTVQYMTVPTHPGWPVAKKSLSKTILKCKLYYLGKDNKYTWTYIKGLNKISVLQNVNCILKMLFARIYYCLLPFP